MSLQVKKQLESSATNSVIGFQQGQLPKSKKKLLNKISKPYQLEDIVAESVFAEEDQIDDVVRKRGSLWVLFDDETDTEISAFKKRKDAWEKQRGYRERSKSQKKIKQREKEARKKKQQGLSVQPKTGGEPQKDKTKNESIEIIKNIAKCILKENYLTYMFEQQPTDDKSVEWDAFIKGMSKEVLTSDQKLKNIITNVAKAEFSTLKKALGVVKDALKATGKFEVKKEKLDKGEGGKEAVYNFDVNLKDDNQNLSFGIKIVNGKPLIYIPDSTREQLNTSNSPAAKTLRSEIIHQQETVLNAMDDVAKSAHKRDEYLSGIESKLDKALGKMGTLELAIVKKLVRNKFKVK